MRLLCARVCVCVLFSWIPPFVLPWGRHASYMPPKPTRTHTHHYHPLFSLFSLLAGFSVTMVKHVCLLFPCYLFHIMPRLPGSLAASARLFVRLWLSFVCFLFVCLLVLCICRTFCLFFFPVPVCVCFSLPAHWLFVWPPGFSTSNSSSPLSALLLCSNTLPQPPSASFLSALPSFFFGLPLLFICLLLHQNIIQRMSSGTRNIRKKK